MEKGGVQLTNDSLIQVGSGRDKISLSQGPTHGWCMLHQDILICNLQQQTQSIRRVFFFPHLVFFSETANITQKQYKNSTMPRENAAAGTCLPCASPQAAKFKFFPARSSGRGIHGLNAQNLRNDRPID